MEINFDSKITNLDDTPALDQNKKPVLLKTICINSLMTDIPQPQGQLEKGETKLKRFILAQKIQKDSKVEVSVEEVALLKERIGMVQPTIIVGKTYELLENNKKTSSK